MLKNINSELVTYVTGNADWTVSYIKTSLVIIYLKIRKLWEKMYQNHSYILNLSSLPTA